LIENDIETVTKARMGAMFAPANAFLQDIVKDVGNPATCNVQKFVDCWMKRPTWERRGMVAREFGAGVFWDFRKTYTPGNACASASGCARAAPPSAMSMKV